MRATVIKILVFGAFFKNLCHAQTYRSQIRYLEENGDGHEYPEVPDKDTLVIDMASGACYGWCTACKELSVCMHGFRKHKVPPQLSS